MELNFIRANKTHFSEILDMMEEFNSIDGYPFQRINTEKNLLKFTENENLGIAWVISYGDSLVGYVVLTFGFSFEYSGRDAFIDELFIKKNYRSMGIGTRTMEFVENEAARLGVNAIHLEVESHNESGNRLYLKLGYKRNNRNLLTKEIKSGFIK